MAGYPYGYAVRNILTSSAPNLPKETPGQTKTGAKYTLFHYEVKPAFVRVMKRDLDTRATR